jgi:hypothetical protein
MTMGTQRHYPLDNFQRCLVLDKGNISHKYRFSCDKSNTCSTVFIKLVLGCMLRPSSKPGSTKIVHLVQCIICSENVNMRKILIRV